MEEDVMSRQLATTLLVLTVVNVAAVAAAPLVEAFALHHGEPGWQGRLYPVFTCGLVVAASLFIVHERLSGRRPAWWAWLALAGALTVTGWAAIAQAVTR
jgi:uncharacterized BrkB/YihY/UPF0761 family membrane protein